jgi:coenzyme F420-dependent glucose-6-phosphate dehydrogenase
LVDAFRGDGGAGKPMYGQLTVCWAESREAAIKTAHEIWPTAGLRGEASQELAVPAHFEQLVEMVTPEAVAEAVVCGPDPDPMIEKIRAFEEAGFENVYLHQVGPDEAGFLRFAERELLPVAGRMPAHAALR